MEMTKYTAIDLFSGAGGLSEGFMQTDSFDFIAHVEWEKPMVDTLRNNLVERWNYTEENAKKSVIRFDIQKTNELIKGNWSEETREDYASDNDSEVIEKGIDGLTKGRAIDIIIGGPPCQAYSLAGRAQDPNSMKDDYRNYLFESFVEVVDHYQPRLFVFENVPGILSASPGDRLVIERICEAFEKIGYEIRKPSEMRKSIYSSADYLVPQNRKRVIIIGVKKGEKFTVEELYSSLDSMKTEDVKKTVRDAIGDLPKFSPLKTSYKRGNRNISHELIGDIKVPLHKARYNNLRDIAAFREWLSDSMNNVPNAEKLEFYNRITGKTTNHNKYRNLEWDKPSPTIVSHLYKDGLMFIHPDIEQLRTITIREAALLQTFPMNFEFVGSDASCFKMIGNAVPVLFAKNIAKSITKVLERK
ncbi:DNA cytosine methyltransferase [Erysipelothrix rhusiopathiae]|nr:DNA cytosine methyltransferase [Erysipelothrix rhusiopathiae]MDE8091819.1 DNA cytosine methyltransferase [Erysipelothrix rhusiopathiae]MDE8097837.1 DNA cytosine methyltransferase [Erysipelothrix rhusiopathiae]MDE8106432.1 DNA cytosine methyltransferase [Erysipelothrix rhusiopathiae]MDE8108188.1 DNA cytosine methyltransferase [Erysipelothrix rhusiopathiae]